MIQIDKVHHFVYGYFFASLLQFYWPAMLAAAVVAGCGKEVYDIVKGGKFKPADFLWTIGGGAFAIVWQLASQSF